MRHEQDVIQRTVTDRIVAFPLPLMIMGLGGLRAVCKSRRKARDVVESMAGMISNTKNIPTPGRGVRRLRWT